MSNEAYALLLYGSEAVGETPTTMSPTTAAAWQAYWTELAGAGIESRVVPLLPTAEARTVQGRSGRPAVTDGPFAETKEQLGGIVVLTGVTRATAQVWAARMPCARAGTIEIRPLLPGSAP